MDDLVFKNIPAEDYNALSVMDHDSNPTTSKPNFELVDKLDEIMTFSLAGQLANLVTQIQNPSSTSVRPVAASPFIFRGIAYAFNWQLFNSFLRVFFLSSGRQHLFFYVLDKC